MISHLCNPIDRGCIEEISKEEYACEEPIPCTGIYADTQHIKENTTLTKDTQWFKLMFREYEKYRRGYLKEFDAYP